MNEPIFVEAARALALRTLREAPTSDDARALGHSLTLQALREHRLDELNAASTPLAPPEEDAEIAAAVSALLFGLGRLQPLLDDEAVTNIEINGCDRVWLSLEDGRVTAGPAVADSDAEQHMPTYAPWLVASAVQQQRA